MGLNALIRAFNEHFCALTVPLLFGSSSPLAAYKCKKMYSLQFRRRAECRCFLEGPVPVVWGRQAIIVSDDLQGAPAPQSSSAVKTPCPWESRGVSAPRCVGSLRGSSPICRFTRVGGIVTNTFFCIW